MSALRFIVVVILFTCLGCATVDQSVTAKTSYVWKEVTRQAKFPQGYNYPVFVLEDKMFALNSGGWISKDGINWTKTGLPETGLNPAYQKYVQFNGAIYALGAMQGNYLNFRLSTKILRTKDGESWETVAEKSNLPNRVFYGAVVFKDKIWIIGGFDGRKYYNDVWNSADGVNWTRVAEKTAFSPRNTSVIVFKNKMLLLGGGVIDGEKNANPRSGDEFWISEDGVSWTLTEKVPKKKRGGTPVVFDGKLWFIGANRNDGNFDSAVMVSEDAENWREMSAPWSPRGGTSVWIFDDKLFMTGGKYSYTEPGGEIKFVYSNDIWVMSRKTE